MPATTQPRHPKHSSGVRKYPGSLKELAGDIGDMTYAALGEFLIALSAKLKGDSAADAGRGRPRLSASLQSAAERIGLAADDINRARRICAPFMKAEAPGPRPAAPPEPPTPAPFSKGQWVAQKEEALRPIFGVVEDVWFCGVEHVWSFNLVCYSPDGGKLGRVTECVGKGPAGYEPALSCARFGRIQKPSFPLTVDRFTRSYAAKLRFEDP